VRHNAFAGSLWILGLLSLFASSCCSTGGKAPVVPPNMPAGPELEHQQEMLVLSFVSYAGELVTGTDEEIEHKLVPCFQKELDKEPLTTGKWKLVWGPAVYEFHHAKFDDNLMYVVQGTDQPNRLVIAVRGTNAPAIQDWIFEDLDVFATEPWRYGNPPSNLEPRISRATHTGLTVLQTMKPAAESGGDLTIQQFLAEQVAKGVTQVDVTGHSLGGALAPTLTLWLADTRAKWDPQGKVALNVYAYAGPTAGNKDFAEYSDSRIGRDTHRVHNQYDLAPLVWNVGTIKTTPALYEPVSKMPEALKLAVDGLILEICPFHYSQIRPWSPPLPGHLLDEKDFGTQVGFQHSCGYLCDLGINSQYVPVTTDCGSGTKKPCVCP
jgi:Lipase (class 3)